MALERTRQEQRRQSELQIPAAVEAEAVVLEELEPEQQPTHPPVAVVAESSVVTGSYRVTHLVSWNLLWTYVCKVP